MFEDSVQSPTWVCFENSISALSGESGVDGEADGWLLQEDGSTVDVMFKG